MKTRVLLLASAAVLAIGAAAAAEVWRGRTCAKCQPGEFGAVATQTIGHGSYTYTPTPGCNGSTGDANSTMTLLSSGAKANLGDYAGAVQDLLQTSEVQQFISDNIHGDLGKALNGGNPNTAQCQNVCAVIPAGAQYTGYEVFAAEDGGGFSKCDPGSDCGIGWSKWVSEPQSSGDAKVQVVCSTFMNWSHDRTRQARLVAYFKPPSNWAPPR